MAMLILPTVHEPPPASVRGWVGATLGELPVVARLHAMLVVDELVDNARRHGRAPYVLRLDRPESGNALLVSVDDCAPSPRGWWPGSGLVLVGALAERWGVERRRSAKTVWAELVFDRTIMDLDAPVPSPRFRPRRARP